MNTDFEEAVDSYMIDNNERFKGYIAQTDLYDENGSMNINGIIEQAKLDVVRLKKILNKEARQILKKQILNAVKKKDYKAVLYLLFFYQNRMPVFTAMLAVNDNTFNIYCQALLFLI